MNNSKNLEKIINYLLKYEFQDIKLIYIKKEKNIDTVTINEINHNIIKEDGFSISFCSNKEHYLYALTNKENFNAIKKEIKKIAKNKKSIKLKEKFILKKEFFLIKETKIEKFDIKKYQKQLINFTKNYNNFMKISISLLYENKTTFIIKPFDKNVYKDEVNYKIDIIMNAIINNINRFNYYSNGSSTCLGFLKKISIYNELKKLYTTLLKMKSINNFNQKKDIVLINGIGGILIHEACGHSLESREIIKESSVFNNINDINNKNINITDNPKLINKFGSFVIDDEGNISKRQELIKNGKIKKFLCDEKGGKALDKNSSSCRRESYYNLFSSRMSNTYIENGKKSFEDIISSTKEGFLIKNILGGVVDTLSGNFSFNCIESYKIIDGKIDYSVCYDNLTIVGNTLEVLKKINMIGNDLKLKSGICGSESGFIYTTVGQPTIKIKNILVVS